MDAEDDTVLEFGDSQSDGGADLSSSSNYQPLSSKERPHAKRIAKTPSNSISRDPQTFAHSFEDVIGSWGDTLSFAPASHISSDSPSVLWSLGDSDASFPLVHKLATRWDTEITRATQLSLSTPTQASSLSSSPLSDSKADSMDISDDDASDSDGLFPPSPYTKRSKKRRPLPASPTEQLFNPALAKVPSVWKVMWSFLGRDFGVAGMLSLLANATLIVPFIALPPIMSYLQYGSEHASAVRATALAVLSVISMALYALFKNQAAFLSARLAIHFSTALRGLFFSKSLRLKFKDQSSIVTEMTDIDPLNEDSQMVPKSASKVAHFALSTLPIIEHYLLHFHTLWSTPLLLLASLVYLWYYAKASTIAGLFAFAAFSVLAQFFGMQADEHDHEQLMRMHHRDNFLEELLTRFRAVKEQVTDRFFDQLLKSHQLALSAPSIFSWSLSFIVSHSISIFASAITIISDALIAGNAVTVQEFIIVTALFGMAQHYIKPYYSLLVHALKMRHAMDQTRMFLLQEETESFDSSNPIYACARYAVITQYYKKQAEVPLKANRATHRDADGDSDRYGGFYEPSPSLESSNSDSALASSSNGNGATLTRSPSGSMSSFTSPFLTPKKLRPFGPSTDAIRFPDLYQIRLSNANFEWGGSGPKRPLKELDLEIRRGALVVVLGGPSSGKSSLFKALLGEMTLLSGNVKIEGAVSYAPQVPWTLQESVRFNIAFTTEPTNMDHYRHVLSLSGLTDDLLPFPDGDMTQLAEAGFTPAQLSRISLARCLYRKVDTYLIDDLFSNFESEERAHQIMETALSAVGSSTRIVALSRYMPIIERATLVVHMKDGEIAHAGSYQELVDSEPGFFESLSVHAKARQFWAQKPSLSNAFARMTSGVTIPSPQRVQNKYDANASLAELIGIESSHIAGPGHAQNGIKFKSGMRYYLKRLGMSVSWITLATLICFILADLGRILGLGIWLEHKNTVFPAPPELTSRERRIKQFPAMASFSFMSIAAAGLFFSIFWVFSGGSHLAANKIWFALVDTILRWPLKVLQRSEGQRLATLVGLEAHRFQAVLPRQFHETLYQVICFCRFVLSTVAASPLSVIVSLPMMFFGFQFHLSQNPTIAGLAQYTTLETGVMSAYYEKVMEGAETIRAFEAESRFTTAFFWRQDQANKARLASLLLSHYVNMRLTLIAVVVMLGVCICAIFISLFGFSSATMFGMAFIYSIHLCETLPSLLYHGTRLITLVHALFNVKSIMEHSPTEDPWTDDSKDPRSVWPSKGTITFSHVTLRRDNVINPVDSDEEIERSQCLLWDFNATFHGGTKIGICGPPTSGRSGIIQAIMRFTTPEKRSSSISSVGKVKIDIDDHPINQLGLHTLRESISIISPQIFSMTLSEYLGDVDDLCMWQALEKVGLKDKVSFTDSKLHTLLASSALELTFNECLLLSMAKALCRRTKIVIFSEPKTGLNKTELNLIKETLFSTFNKHTLIIISNSAIFLEHVDTVFVLEQGSVVQEGSPEALRAQPSNSPFNRLFRHHEEAMVEHEFQVAEQGNLIDL